MSENLDKEQLIAQYSQLPLDTNYMRLVAHDVRNHMNTIMMANDLLREEVDDEDGDPQKYIKMISHASDDILVILEVVVAALSKRDASKVSEES